MIFLPTKSLYSTVLYINPLKIGGGVKGLKRTVNQDWNQREDPHEILSIEYDRQQMNNIEPFIGMA